MREGVSSWICRLSEYRDDLLRLAKIKLKDVLSCRLTADDIVQETLKNACKRQAFFEQKNEISDMRKLTIILEQTICAMERRYLQSAKRDLYKEEHEKRDNSCPLIHQHADSAAGPFTMAVHRERAFLIRKAMHELSPADFEILSKRIFLGLTNQECAIQLGMSEKNASIRFVRAMHRLQAELSKYTHCHES